MFAGLSFALLNCQSKPQESRTEVVESRTRWTAEKAKQWYYDQPWLVGCNFIPSTAINQLEMWQAASFDTASIKRELGLAAGLGMNTVRVYLHDLLYEQDSTGFFGRMETFLEISASQKIKPMFVLFDSVWDPFPKLGKQRSPRPHVHNSGWVQSPGKPTLLDTTQYARLSRYVRGTINRFRSDVRILAWDLWNEPENQNGSAYGTVELPNKGEIVYPLLKRAFEDARSVNPIQPLTAGLWQHDWSEEGKLTPINKLMIEESDVITFHCYDGAEELEERIEWLKQYGRPLLCTEYMARGNKSTFESSLPILKKHRVGAYNWGLVAGKTQTQYPWDSWKKAYTREPDLWFHDIFRANGTPYRMSEVLFIRRVVKEQ